MVCPAWALVGMKGLYITRICLLFLSFFVPLHQLITWFIHEIPQYLFGSFVFNRSYGVMDSSSPFVIPPHLRNNIDEFERSYTPKAGATKSEACSTLQDLEIKQNIFSWVQWNSLIVEVKITSLIWTFVCLVVIIISENVSGKHPNMILVWKIICCT